MIQGNTTSGDGKNMPAPVGLYRPEFEHDACGVSFVVDLHGRSSHDLVDKGLMSLCNLDHRGAKGAEENTGDGAGILVQIPDAFLRAVDDFELPPVRAPTRSASPSCRPTRPSPPLPSRTVEKICADEGLAVLGWRDVPIDPSMIGATALAAMPVFRQLFVADAAGERAGIDLDRLAYVVRKRIEHEIVDGDGESAVYFPSLSARTLVYKGMLTTPQLGEFFPDLTDERFESALAHRALAVLDQHVPVLAAGPPVPLRRPQRRDQHGPGQPELDAGP